MITRAVLVSVIIPAYNAEAFLGEAITSVMRQEYYPLEIIVVDDGSTDRTAHIAADFGAAVKLIQQANAGPAAARNTGISAAQGEVLAFLDADDQWADGAMDAQVSHLAGHPSAGIALGLTQLLRLCDSEGVARFEPFGEPWHLLSLGAAAIRRDSLRQVGRFDESMRSAEDADWFLRAGEAGVALARHPHVVQYYRLHENNATRNKEWRNAHLALALKKSLERRRQKGAYPASVPSQPLSDGEGEESP